MTQLWPWRNYIGHLVGHEGAGSLQSFLKRQGRGDLHVVMGNGVSCPKTRARAQIMERDLQGKHCETFSLNLGRPYDHWHLSDMSHIFFLGCLGKATVKRQKGSGPGQAWLRRWKLELGRMRISAATAGAVAAKSVGKFWVGLSA